MSLTIAQTSRPKGRHHWHWTVRLAGTAEELDRVQSVEYTLHPTFSPPVHRVEDRASSFQLEGSGWGEFMIHVMVRHRDGSTTALEHWLELEEDDAAAASGAAASTPGFAAPGAGAPSPSPVQAAPRASPGPEPLRPAPAPAAPLAPAASAASEAAAADAPSVVLPGGSASPPRTLYLSAGLADRAAAQKVRESLASSGVGTRAGDDPAATADSVEQQIRRELEGSDAAVFVVSERPSPWVRHELAVAREMRLPLAVVLTGATTPMASELSSGAAMVTTLPAADDGADAMRPLVAWAAALPIRNKRPGSRLST